MIPSPVPSVRPSAAARALFTALAAGAAFVAGAALSSGPAGAAEGDRTAPPSTHRRVSASLPEDTAWLIPARVGKKITLFAMVDSGGLFRLFLEAGRLTPEAGRLRAARLQGPPGISPKIPPVSLGGGVIAGPGEDGSLLVIDLFNGKFSRIPASRALSPLSRPAALSASLLAAVGRDGSLIVFEKKQGGWRETQLISGTGALVDAVLTAADLDGDGAKELIVPASPTGRYGHGVLGDAIEPAQIRVYRLSGGRLEFLAAHAADGADGGGVFEAIGALAADLDGDGRSEILITRSEAASGAAHLALALRGGKLIRKGAGEAIGLGHRWSHLLGAFGLGGMGAGGKTVLAVETPHLAGYLLALELRGPRLAERARRPGFTTHAIGSRNLWRHAVIRRGGAHEIVLPEIGGSRLAALSLLKNRRGLKDRWALRWTIPLSAPLRSNIAAADFNGDGRDDLAFADAAGRVHVLLSR